MASSFAWLSVLIKKNQQVIRPRTVVKCSWEDTFEMLPGKLNMQAEITVEKVEICANEKFVDAHIVPIDAPVSLTEQFKCSYVCLSLERDEVPQSSGTQRNAAEVLRASSRQIVLPAPLTPPEGKELRKDQQMYNDILCQLETMGVGWSPCSKQTGSNFVHKLTQALWYIDPHHSKFVGRGIHLPDRFSMYRGYNDFKKKKEKEPRPRCIYSPSVLSPKQLKEIEGIKDSKLYTCGSALLPPDSSYANSIIVREAIVCSSYLEPQYYSSVLVHFPPACYYCGLGEDSLVNDDELKELKEMYAVVYPICFICQSDGKKPHCKQPSNLAKRRKT